MQANDLPCEFVNRSKQQTPSPPHSANAAAMVFQNFRVSRSIEVFVLFRNLRFKEVEKGYVSLEGILGVEKIS
jgi:hypothetical protein